MIHNYVESRFRYGWAKTGEVALSEPESLPIVFDINGLSSQRREIYRRCLPEQAVEESSRTQLEA